MQLEKLDLLEKRLGQFVERFAQLKEENAFLRQRLESQTARVEALEKETADYREQKEQMRQRLDRIAGVVERLEQMQDGSEEAAE